MTTLSENWITERHIDFEYKKYVLLAYLKEVSERFTESRLYPSLAELVMHYRNVVALRNSKNSLYDSFPGAVSGVDISNFSVLFEKLTEDDHLMQEISSIIDFSIPQFEKHIAEGRQIYDFIESRLNIFPVGIIPLHTDEGYLFLKYAPERETMVFEYQITIFENPDERYRGISTSYIASFPEGLNLSFEQIKLDLIRYRTSLPNPATYVIESELKVPLQETLLPLAKRAFVRHLATL
ncbi:MAG TPA: hypothetical protein VFW78_07720 [Bacteroidia bacterium]|nr:hypothetical protein [Bacteroidia bacterium]